MGNYTIFWMFENPRRGRQARNFTTDVPKILDLKSSSEQIFSKIDVECLCFKNVEWTIFHDIQLAKEILLTEPYRFKPRTV